MKVNSSKPIKVVSDVIDRNDLKALSEWMLSEPTPRLTKGPLTKKLESKWATKIGTRFSVFVNSGSSAILLTLAAIKYLSGNDRLKIVVPALSWATDVSSPLLLDMDTIMCDCNLKDLSCDLKHLEIIFKIERPKIFILVSPLGLVPNMDKIVKLCNEYNVILLEDVCESLGSKHNGQYLGSIGHASFFSMYFGHHLSTIEGGFINTNDENLYHTLLMMRSHGWDRDLPEWKKKKLRSDYNLSEFEAMYNFYVPGFNLRSTDFQAFLGLRALDKMNKFCLTREKNYKYYSKLINVNELFLGEENNFISNFAYPIINKNRKEIVSELIKSKVEVRPLIAGNIANKPLWQKDDGENYPNANHVDKYGFYIPNHQDLTISEAEKIIKIVNKFGIVNKKC